MLAILALSCAAAAVPARAHRTDERLSVGATYTHAVFLRRGELLRGTVEQQGVDLVVRLRAADGRLLLEVDSPNGDRGPEPLLFVAESTGEHRIEVSALEPEDAGAFTIDLPEPRAATSRDRQEVEASVLWARSWAARAAGQRGEAGASRHYEEARRGAERALALHGRLFGSDHPTLAGDLELLGYIHDEVGDFAAGETAFARALAIRERANPPDPHLIVTRSDLGWLKLMRGDLAGARAAFESVLAVEAREGTRQGLAEVLEKTGDFDGALEMRRGLLADDERARGTSSPSLAPTLVHMARIVLAQGRPEEARAFLDRAAALSTPSPQGRVREATPLEVEAELELVHGDPERARQALARAHALRTAAFGPAHPTLARTLTLQGRLALKQGRTVLAGRLLREARTIGERTLGRNHLTVAAILHAQAELYETEGRCAAARAAYGRAIAIREGQVRPDHPDLVGARRALEALRT